MLHKTFMLFFFSSFSLACGRTSTSWRLLTSSGCGHAGSVECVKNHEGCPGAKLSAN